MAKMIRAAAWGNRIIATGEVAAGQFLANPANWRTHGLTQEGQLASVLHDIGFVAMVMVNRRSAPEWGRDRNVETLVDGHLRVKAALARGEEQMVPVSYVDLTPDEERRVLLTLDPIGALAGRDETLLEDLKQQVAVEWAESELDLDALVGDRKPRERTKGLKHDVRACTCCKGQCSPGCGCYEEPR
jgi:hypothetical protein